MCAKKTKKTKRSFEIILNVFISRVYRISQIYIHSFVLKSFDDYG